MKLALCPLDLEEANTLCRDLHRHHEPVVLPTLPKEAVRDHEDGLDFDWLERPTDFAAWRAAIAADPQIGGDNSNLAALVDILEREPEYWLYVSQ